MKKCVFLTIICCVICLTELYSQTNNIKISAVLNTERNEIEIQQEIDFYNKSNQTLNEIHLHDWPNSYSSKRTPLAKRFIEAYTKSFHFEKNKHRGKTYILNFTANSKKATWYRTEKDPDIVKVLLKEPLKPYDSVKLTTNYVVKIPKDKFTGYGVNGNSNNLRFWYLVPAIFTNKWITYNNLDMDDLYMDFTNYQINFEVPNTYVINSDLVTSTELENDKIIYSLKGKNKLDIELNITEINDFSEYNTKPFRIVTNLNSDKLNLNVKTDILNREILFIQSYLGEFPHEKLLINNVEYDKNPVYGFNQLPSFLAPFSDTFEWDIKIFKVLTKKYIENLFLFNQRKDAWLADGLQTYLMIKYVEKYYPEIKAIGEISKLWGIRNFNLAKIDFNEKYPFVYQFAARRNLDQPLTTQADSLSNFNRLIVNKYKAGLGLKYLEKYLDEATITKAIQSFSKENAGNFSKSNAFLKHLETTKDISWFVNDYLTTNKKVDYTIKSITKKKDSLEVSILNKRNMTVPIQLFGIKDKEVKFKKWIIGVDSLTKITIPKNGFNRLSLNYDGSLPEFNLKNNWKNIDKKIFNRPLQVKFFKDIEDPYYNQLFYTPVYRYNYYDGLVLGMALSNKTLLKKSFNYKLTPSYSTKSKSFSGSYAFLYEYLPENKKINKFSAGLVGNNYHYAENLSYNIVNPFAMLEFKRKSLRDVSSKAIIGSYTFVDREKSPTQTQHPETNKYNVFSLGFGYAKPDIIKDIRFSTGIEVANKFSKLSVTARYRILTDTNRQFDFRFFAGTFLKNKTETDYFSYSLDRPTDYLFQYDYLGRSETSGFLSQQIIITEGGFKSKLPISKANQWMTTINTSIGLWRWLEVYNDVGFVKNRNEKAYFVHENGIRLNFIQDILEVYFPVHSNLGWEIAEPNYSSKIRFVLVIKPKRIYNFIRRGFY